MSAAEQRSSPTPEEFERHKAIALDESRPQSERNASAVWLGTNGVVLDVPEQPVIYPAGFTPNPAIGGTGRKGLQVVGAVGKKEELTYRLKFDCAADIEPQEVRWLWEGRIPAGCVSIVCGDPGVGKSTIASALAVTVSTGGEWPDRPGRPVEEGTVLYFTAEESKTSVIVPRLERFGANLEKVHLMKGVEASDGTALGFSLSRDIKLLEAAVEQMGDVRLVIIDPITAYLGDGNEHKDTEVRAFLQPLCDLAERKGLAVVLICHLNKGTTTNILYRLANSIAFAAIARMIWYASKHPFERNHRSLTFVKGNYCDDGRPKGLPYRMEKRKFVWGTDAVDLDAEEVAIILQDQAAKMMPAKKPGPKADPLEQAKDFIATMMERSGAVLLAVALRFAMEKGIKESTFNKAVDDLVEEKKIVKHKPPGERRLWLEPFPGSQPELPLAGVAPAAESPPAPAVKPVSTPAAKTAALVPPGLAIRASDIDQFYADGVISFRFSAVPVWSVVPPGKTAPAYGVVAASEEQARAFVATQHSLSAAAKLTVRLMTGVDRRLCSVYFDGRPSDVQ